MRKALKKAAASALAATLALAVVAGAGNTASAAKAKKAAFDPAGTYHAYVGFQQSGTWIFHDECTSETTGIGGSDLGSLNYETDVMKSGDNGTEKIDGTVQGAEITGNGTYVVNITGLNGALLAQTGDDIKLTMVYISTDMPADAKDKVQFSDVTLKMDGKTVELPADQFFKPETLDNGYTSLYLVDTYAKGQGEYDSPEPMSPNDSIEITFTVSGFTNDNPNAVPPTPTPEPTEAATSSSATSDDSEDSGSSVNGGVVAVVVAAVVVIAGGVVIFTRKKK